MRASSAARPPSRRAFWFFVVAVALGVAGGGAIAMLGRRSVAERRGHPDTIAPAERDSTSTPAPTSTPTRR